MIEELDADVAYAWHGRPVSLVLPFCVGVVGACGKGEGVEDAS
jgi:hypothetical protein